MIYSLPKIFYLYRIIFHYYDIFIVYFAFFHTTASSREARTIKGSDEPGRGPEVSGERISNLIEAIGRIGASLEHDTVLTEVVEGARALTGARYGSIVTIGEAGAPRDFLTRGITEGKRRAAGSRFRAWGKECRADVSPV